MTNILLAVITLVFVIIRLLVTEKIKKNAWRWWYMPWISLIFTVLAYLVCNWMNIPKKYLPHLTTSEYQIEVAYCILCLFLWIPLSWALRSPSIHQKLIGLYRNLFCANDKNRDKALPFPYFYDTEGKVKSRVGTVFYRWALKTVALFGAVAFSVSFLIPLVSNTDFNFISSFGILGLLPILEYYIYLNADAQFEEETIETIENKAKSSFDDLWNLYVDRFDDFSVAWNKDTNREFSEKCESDFDTDMENLYVSFKDSRSDGIIEDCDLATAFSRLEPFFMQVIKDGHYVLVAFDVPKHFTEKNGETFLDEIAQKLKTILERRFPEVDQIIRFTVYDEWSTDDVFKNSIVMAPLSLLARKGVKDYHWLKNLGLVTVVNVFDKGVSNLYESRKFYYMLRSVNADYQILTITPYHREIEPSFHQIWLTNQNMVEIKYKQHYKGLKQYFLGYDFENYMYRFGKVLSSTPTEKLSSGSEMFVFPLTSKVGYEQKTITPIHNLELAYTNGLETIEEFNKFNDFVNEDFSISSDSIWHKNTPHLLPVDEILESQVFSVIYDQENNSPVAYRKWMHLGYEENFCVVISKPYMFRDYFNDNHDYFVKYPFVALQPKLCKSKITLAIILLNLLRNHPQEENQLRSHLLDYYDKSEINSVPSKLKELFITYFSADLANSIGTMKKIVFDGKEYHVKVFYFLEADQISLPYLELITVIDSSGNVLFDILRDLWAQNFSKGQYHSFSGRCYQIQTFDEENKTLTVGFGQISNVLFYRPVLSVSLSGMLASIKDLFYFEEWYHPILKEKLSFRMLGFETNLRVKTSRWISFMKYSAPCYDSSSSIIPANGLGDERFYRRGKVLKVSFGYLRKYTDRIDDIRKSLQVLIYESLYSLFPHYAQYLLVSSEGEGDCALPWIFNCFSNNEIIENDISAVQEKQNGYLTYYFIEDANIDLGLIGALTKENIWYLMGYIYDYLLWLVQDGSKKQQSGYVEYRKKANLDKLAFLKYGGEQLPSYFDIDLLIGFFRDYFNGDFFEASRMRFQNVFGSAIGNCDFCGREMKNSEMQRLEDGRMRCPECSKDAVDTEGRFLELCKQVVEKFNTHLGIDFNAIKYQPRLISAVELHKVGGYEFSVTNGYDVRKIVGLACNRETDVFYVENGYSPEKTFGIIAHEMTHIWEYNSEDFKKVKATNNDLVEGLAVWSDLFLSEKNGATNIEGLRQSWLARTDEYGRGLKFIMDNCPDDPYGFIKQKAAEMK